MAGPKLDLADEWILSRINEEIKEVNSLLDAYRFHEAATSLYEFVWHELCDWYLELVKPRLSFPHLNPLPHPATIKKEDTLKILAYGLRRSLKLLHPFMPFITEEIWQALKIGEGDLMVSSWPEVEERFIKPEVREKMDFLKEFITSIRHLRTEANLKPQDKIIVRCTAKEPRDLDLIRTYTDYIKLLARAVDIIISSEKPAEADKKIALSIEKLQVG
jgi:valyl-tRNA synthetase